MLTPYATGPSPVYYGSGYLPSKDYWRLGAIFGVLFIAVLIVVAVPWLALIRQDEPSTCAMASTCFRNCMRVSYVGESGSG